MNRRGFVGATLAGLGGLFFPRKSEAKSSKGFKFGDCVNIEAPEGHGRITCQGFITYVDEGSVIIKTRGWEYLCHCAESGRWYYGSDEVTVSRRGER